MLAEAYPDEPENVQLVALLSMEASGAAVIRGAATGSAKGEAAAIAAKASTRVEVRETIVNVENAKSLVMQKN